MYNVRILTVSYPPKFLTQLYSAYKSTAKTGIQT